MTAQKPRSDAQQAITAQNELRIVQLRIESWSFQEIADELQMSKSGVADAFHRVMDRTKEETRDAELHRRELTIAQYEADLYALNDKAADGDSEAIRTRAVIRQHLRALIGLDAPTKFTTDQRVEVHITGGEGV